MEEKEIKALIDLNKHPDTPDHSELQENEYLKKLKRADVKDFILKYHPDFDKDIVEELRGYLYKPFFVQNAGMNKVPNICIIKRSSPMNLSAYYCNRFTYFVSKQKRWDKDVIIIID